MGGAMAERLAAAGHEVRGFDISPAARARFRAAGHAVASSPAEAASGADIAILCLPDGRGVERVLQGASGLLTASPPPPICIDHTSSDPRVTRVAAELLGPRGTALVDAPVSGGVSGARNGSLTAIVGGDRAVVERVRPVLGCVAARVMHAGPLGAGHAVKAINNALSSAALITTAELLVGTSVNGIAPDVALRAVNASEARSQNSEVKLPEHVLSGRFASGFSIALMRKDVATACAMARASRSPVPLTALQSEIWSAAEAEFGPDADHTLVVRLLAGSSPRRADAPDSQGPSLTRWCDAVAAALSAATAELTALAVAEGLDPDTTLRIVNASSGRNEITRAAAPHSMPGAGLARLNFAQAMASLDHVVQAAGQRGVSVPLSALAAQSLRLSAGRSDDDRDLVTVVAGGRSAGQSESPSEPFSDK
ncbi:MAG: 3-hydroxyisobutyrate dehydrogenase [Solirubrobacteraceae bacterium]